MSLKDRIVAEIQATGPMTVARYMELALSDPEEGYYMTRDPLGASGDFITAPEISQIFGELCGIWLAENWYRQNQPEANLVELGPGRGTLMDDVLRATRHALEFHKHIQVHMVETSPILRAMQQEKLKAAHPYITWHERLPEGDRPLFLIANEFFDALPIHQYIGEEERKIIVTENGLEFQPEHGAVRETCPCGIEIVTRIARRIARCGGAALIIDYGYRQGSGDTLQAMRRHRYDKILQEPGKVDLTAHVNFLALAEAAKKAGAKASSVFSQREFLERMGGRMRAERLARPDVLLGYERLVNERQMGGLFLALAITPERTVAPVFEE